jgi:dolichol-phosphate mannosyltransferase
MLPEMLVTVLIPCRDEAPALAPLFAELLSLPALLRPARYPEIVFVDDGSRDATAPLLWDFADAAHFPVRIVGLKPNRGLGAALREGAALAAGEVIVTYDADRPYPLADLPRLVDAVSEGADVATASPWHPEGSSQGLALHRTLLSRSVSALYRLRFRGRGGGLHTFTCGYRAYRREVFLAHLPRRNGFTATAEILVRALAGGARVVEIPSVLRTRTEGRSKLRVMRTALAHAGLLLMGR